MSTRKARAYALGLCLIWIATALRAVAGEYVELGGGTEQPLIWLKQAHVGQEHESLVELPYTLERGDPRIAQKSLQLTLKLQLKEKPSSTWAIFIPKMSIAGNVAVNGTAIGSCAPMPVEKLRCLHQPTFLSVPETIWKQGLNQIEFDLYINDRQTNGLSEVAVGDAQRIYRELFMPRYLLIVTSLEILTWVSLFLGTLLLVIGTKLPHDRTYLWFAAAILAVALSNLNGLLRTPPAPESVWSTFVFVSRMVTAPLMMLAITSFYQVRWLWYRGYLMVFCLIAPLVVIASDNDLYVVATLNMSSLIMGFILLVMTPYWSWKSKDWRQSAMCASYYLIAFAAIHDWLKHVGSTGFNTSYLVSYASAAALILMGSFLVSLLVESLKTAKDLTDTLEQKVSAKEIQLQAAYERRLELEHMAAITQERERLMRDMHDGLGSSLSSTLLALRRKNCSLEQASEMLNDCLDDLRLMLEASQCSEGLLSNAMADFRYRMEPRLSSFGLHTKWMLDMRCEQRLSSSSLLQIMRVIQEAIHNVVRHAYAHKLEIEVHFLEDELTVRVADDGVGITEKQHTHRGRGLNNMYARAKSLRGQLLVQRVDHWTVVRMQVPIPVDDCFENSRSALSEQT